MLFTHKDESRKILVVYEELIEGSEEVASGDPALVGFITKNIPSAYIWWVGSVRLGFVAGCWKFSRCVDRKKMIMFMDLPNGAQQKLMERRGVRK